MQEKVALITGGARRVGATIAQTLHAKGMNIIIHYHHSSKEAENLINYLNDARDGSAFGIQGDLSSCSTISQISENAFKKWGRLDVLINNASCFYPTPIDEMSEEDWEDLINTNLKAPLFLSKHCAPFLEKTQGCIINMSDIHAEKPLRKYLIYSLSKAGLNMLTKSLAKELSPTVRVNAIAPGAVCWPENKNALTESQKEKIIQKSLLKRAGAPEDVAKAVSFFVFDAPYITGQILRVDGGRDL